MNYCQYCAAPLVLKIPEGEDRERYCCEECDTVFYQNPKNVVGTLPVYQDKVLLCRRAIEPRYGKWTLPAGFMENGETCIEGAIRETAEEAGAKVHVKEDSLYTLTSYKHINQVHFYFRVELASLDFAPGIESLEVRLFRESEIPWDHIAFTVVNITLKHYFKDCKNQHFPVRMFDVTYSNKKIKRTLVSKS